VDDQQEIPWPELFIVLAAAVSIVLAMSQVLPLQNVVLAAIIIGVIGVVANTLAVALNQSFGRFAFPHALVREPILEAFPWIVPLLWVIAVLSSRGTSQLILLRRRNTSRYGLELMACTSALCLTLILASQVFYIPYRNPWITRSSLAHIAWLYIPPVAFVGWIVVTLVTLVLVTPVLINKKPGVQPIIYQPLINWIVIALVLISAELRNGMWIEGPLVAVVVVLVSLFAMGGASRSEP
jgi:hypothetical protein